MEGYLKKKCMVVLWSTHVVVLPKMFKYIVRYFFIKGNQLCYTKTKKEHDAHKTHKMLVDLTKVIALHVFPSKMEVVDDGGRHIVLKSSLEEIKRWVPALAAKLPKVDSIVDHMPGVNINELMMTQTPPWGSDHETPGGPTTPRGQTPPSPIPVMPGSASSSPLPPRMVNPAFPLFPLAENTHASTPPPQYPGQGYPTSPYSSTPPPAYPGSFYANSSIVKKLPSFRTTSSLSFTLTSKQCASWLGNSEDSILSEGVSGNTSGNSSRNNTIKLNRSSFGMTAYGPSTPVQNLGWDEWDAIFSRFQRNEEVY